MGIRIKYIIVLDLWLLLKMQKLAIALLDQSQVSELDSDNWVSI